MSRDTRKCIKDFVQHVERLEAEEDVEGNGFNREYRLIHEVQVKNRRENVFQMTAGRADNNLKKNRYKDILPYDEHRVLLSSKEGEENSDYINASRLMGVKGTGGYIASQGPLAATVDDFWRMIWECNVEIVFMACKIVELGKIKCKQYWHDVDKSETFGDIDVFTEAEEEISSDFIRRKFRVQRNGEERQVVQFHYLGWPDHGIPDDPAHIRDLISIVRQTRKNDQAPLLVHCSAGCGRTGAIVAIDFVWTLLEHGRFDETFSLYDLICNLREQRMSMVQTADQYALVNKVLKTLCEEWLDKMASHTYVNVDLKQAADVNDDHQKRVILSPNNPEVNCNVIHDRLQGQAADSNLNPDEADPPSYMAPKPPTEIEPSSSNYNNVIILPNQSPVFRRAKVDDSNNSPPEDKSTKDDKETTIHTTVIQLGPGSATPAPTQITSSSGGAHQVVNFVRGSSTSSSKSSITSSSSAAPGVTPPTSPATTTAPVWTPPQQENDLSAVYATVNKGRSLSQSSRSNNNTAQASLGTPARSASVKANSKTPQPSGGTLGLQILTDSDGYSQVQVLDGNKGASVKSNSQINPSSIDDTDPYSLAHNTPLQVSADRDPYSLAIDAPTNVPMSKPVAVGVGAEKNPNGSKNAGFGDRLPRVRGPQPTPESWNKEQ